MHHLVNLMVHLLPIRALKKKRNMAFNGVFSVTVKLPYHQQVKVPVVDVCDHNRIRKQDFTVWKDKSIS